MGVGYLNGIYVLLELCENHHPFLWRWKNVYSKHSARFMPQRHITYRDMWCMYVYVPMPDAAILR